MPLLRVDALSRRALGRRVLDRVTLEVAEGECLALLGEPGSGRASLLRVIAGLEEPDEGRILLDGADLTRVPLRRRQIGHLFQHDPLFGHATVFDAVAAAMPERVAEESAEARAAQVHRLLGLVGLAADAGSMPVMLPGPRRRRLSLARALAAGPRLLLVGEGFGAADPARRQPRRWLRDICQRLELTMILVATDAEEAATLADRVAVLDAGRVIQLGTPATLLRAPANATVARLIGGTMALSAADAAGAVPGFAASGLWLQAEALEVVAPALGVPARVLGATMLGATVRLDLELVGDGTQLEAEVPGGIGGGLSPGTIIGLRLRDGPRQGGHAVN